MQDLHNPTFGKHGYIQVYTGDGKGKTTAAMGLACRALGRGYKVLIMQFCKDKELTGEYKHLANHVDGLIYKSCGLPSFIDPAHLTEDDIKAAIAGWNYVLKHHKEFDMIIMDELNIAVDFGLIQIEEVITFLDYKPESLEIVITGRNAPPEIIERAHLVTEMKPIKHYWSIGVLAREGIEF